MNEQTNIPDISISFGGASVTVNCAQDLDAALAGLERLKAIVGVRATSNGNGYVATDDGETDRLATLYAEVTGKRFKNTTGKERGEALREWAIAQGAIAPTVPPAPQGEGEAPEGEGPDAL